MDKIAMGAASDRRDLFSESASRLGMGRSSSRRISGFAGF